MKASPIKRFAISMGLLTPVGLLVSLMNVWMDFSYGVSFLTLAATGVLFSMIVLHGNPRYWFHRRPRQQRGAISR
ncbi:MAG TPA: hypothetical protein VFX85_03385 [Solirubrobacterales bacterium]|nr:hypothetical protein [Solirubrobacterales bacterium]